MIRKTLIALLCGVTTSHSTTNGTDPVELPAIVVSGWVEDDFGYLGQALVWTQPYNSMGSQNMKGLQYAGSRICYGRMIGAPALLHGPHHTLGGVNFQHSFVASVIIDTDGDPREQGFDPKWQSATSTGSNAAVVPFACYNAADRAAGVGPGDWCQIENPVTGNWIWGIAGDYSGNHPQGEISEAAAYLMGWPFYANSNTMFTYTVTVKFWPHSAGL